MADQINIGTQYGPAVLGEEEFRKQQAVAELTSNNTYGALVLGEDRTAQLQAIIKGEAPAPPAAPEPTPAAPAVESFSIDALKATLAAQPERLKDMVAAEIERPEGPRPQAVEAFIDAAHAGNHDEEFLKALYALLG